MRADGTVRTVRSGLSVRISVFLPAAPSAPAWPLIHLTSELLYIYPFRQHKPLVPRYLRVERFPLTPPPQVSCLRAIFSPSPTPRRCAARACPSALLASFLLRVSQMLPPRVRSNCAVLLPNTTAKHCPPPPAPLSLLSNTASNNTSEHVAPAYNTCMLQQLQKKPNTKILYLNSAATRHSNVRAAAALPCARHALAQTSLLAKHF